MSGGECGDAKRPAALLDRDGTIIEDRHYIGRPEDVALLPGAADAIRRLNDLGVPVIVVSNQSGIARGYFTTEDAERVRRAFEAALAAHGARIDATYICPHHPDVSGPCDCRKPGLALYRRAASEHRLDLARSAFIGDRWRDVQPALALGGRGILLPSSETPLEERARAERDASVAPSLGDAVQRLEGWWRGAGSITSRR